MKLNNFYDVIIIGSGPAGSVVAANLSQTPKSILLIEEGAKLADNFFESPLSYLTSKLYRHSGALPFFGPFTFPFGEAKAFGGGSIINGGLIWNTPAPIIKRWRQLLPNSVFNSQTWNQTELDIAKKLGISTYSGDFKKDNIASSLLINACMDLNWKVVLGPRALEGCQNLNKCSTGCPSGAKQSTPKNFLQTAINNNCAFSLESKVISINKRNKSYEISYEKNKILNKINCNNVIITAGATQSANLLKKNNLSKNAGTNFEFHLNFKVLALFPEHINGKNATIFTHQVQEFEDEGILLMGTNFQLSYVLNSLSHVSPDVASKFIGHFNQLGLYASMIKPDAKAKLHCILGQDFGTWKWNTGSFEMAKKSILYLSKLLLKAGALELILPLRNCIKSCKSIQEVESHLNACREKDLIGVSVHGMSACRMGNDEKNSTVDINGKVWNQDNIFVADSSILPSNLGESPQGTIMATAHELSTRWIHQKLLR